MLSPRTGGWVKWRTAFLVCCACIVEGADMAVLPAVYLFVSRSLHASPSDLGIMTLCRALVQAMTSPISGVLGNRYDRTAIIAAGAALWSACTIGVSASNTVAQACVFTSINGFGLALVIPCAQSIMADYFPAEQRGRAFGAMQLTMSAGSMLGSLFATNVAAHPHGMTDGWRYVMRCVSAVSVTVAVLMTTLAVDPRQEALLTSRVVSMDLDTGLPRMGKHSSTGAVPRSRRSDDEEAQYLALETRAERRVSAEHQHAAEADHRTPRSPRRQLIDDSGRLKREGAHAEEEEENLIGRRGPGEGAGPAGARSSDATGGSLGEVWQDLKNIAALPTFRIIIAQGIVGTVPWNAIAFLTLWLQLRGFSDWKASVLSAAFYGATSAGAYLGGYIGDMAANLLPSSGRIITAQVSVLSGLPLTFILFSIPGSESAISFYAFLAAIIVLGLCISWCGTGCNSPIFAEIVPPNKRALIYAFDRCFEGALAACAAPLVGVIAERGFGYIATESAALEAGAAADVIAANAAALGSSLLWCLCVPWGLCFLFYFGLFKTYPVDRARIKRVLDEDMMTQRNFGTATHAVEE